MAFAVFRELGSSDLFIKTSVWLGPTKKGFQTAFRLKAENIQGPQKPRWPNGPFIELADHGYAAGVWD